MAKFTFHNPGGSSYFVLRTIPRESDGAYPTSSAQINFISGSSFSDVTSSVEKPFVVNDFKWGAVIPNGTSSFVWPSGSTENATTVPASESQMSGTGNGTVTIGETTFTLPFNFTFAPELTPGGGGGGGGGLTTTSNAFSMVLVNADDTHFDTGIDVVAGADWTISFWIATGGGATPTTPTVTFPLSIGGGVGNASFLRFHTGWNNSGRAPSLQTDNADGENWDTYSPVSMPDGNTSAFFNDGNWHHLAISRLNSTQNITLYIDGVFTQWRDFQNSYPDTDGLRLNPSGRLYLGHPTKPANAVIDEVAYFTSSLDASTIESIYSASLPLGSGVTADLTKLDTPPVAWYRMGD